MLRSRILLLVVVGALSAGTSAAFASTHHARPVVKHPAAKFLSNVHYPCHSPGAHISPAQL